MQAIILAAGMGKRLKELTSNNTKCMVPVNGVRLIERMLRQLDALKMRRIVLVVGYQCEQLMSFVSTLDIKTPIVYVVNDVYAETNNIYSLYLARKYMAEDDTLLLESDLIFEDSVLSCLIENPYPSLALVAKYESWMDGTVVTLGSDDTIKEFLDKKHFKFSDIDEYYKTVNIYKFGRTFSAQYYVPFLEAYCAALGNNEYYEQVLKVITILDQPEIKALPLRDGAWYEIDDAQDLDIAESIFANSAQDKLKKIMRRYGGYWRYPAMLDYCYLVNPYFPPQTLMDEMKAKFEDLTCTYPSGQAVNSLLAAKYFGLKDCQIAVGNGAAELIKSVIALIPGRMGLIAPTFEEYYNRKIEDIELMRAAAPDYRYTKDDVIRHFDGKDISTLVIVNPDNPTGNYISRNDILELADWCGGKGCTLVLDESFVDFEAIEDSLLDADVLDAHLNLVVVKSISKSFGVPGYRLGVLASSNAVLMGKVKKDLSIWNINSFGEFFLQVFEKYIREYKEAMRSFRDTRDAYIKRLADIPQLRVLPTSANYVMCEVLGKLTATQLAEVLLEQHKILIKDLSGKNGISGNYIRLGIRTHDENEYLCDVLGKVLS